MESLANRRFEPIILYSGAKCSISENQGVRNTTVRYTRMTASRAAETAGNRREWLLIPFENKQFRSFVAILLPCAKEGPESARTYYGRGHGDYRRAHLIRHPAAGTESPNRCRHHCQGDFPLLKPPSNGS